MFKDTQLDTKESNWSYEDAEGSRISIEQVGSGRGTYSLLCVSNTNRLYIFLFCLLIKQ